MGKEIPAEEQERIAYSTSPFGEALTRVKTMVRMAANTSAWLIEQEGDLVVRCVYLDRFCGLARMLYSVKALIVATVI